MYFLLAVIVFVYVIYYCFGGFQEASKKNARYKVKSAKQNSPRKIKVSKPKPNDMTFK